MLFALQQWFWKFWGWGPNMLGYHRGRKWFSGPKWSSANNFSVSGMCFSANLMSGCMIGYSRVVSSCRHQLQDGGTTLKWSVLNVNCVSVLILYFRFLTYRVVSLMEAVNFLNSINQKHFWCVPPRMANETTRSQRQQQRLYAELGEDIFQQWTREHMEETVKNAMRKAEEDAMHVERWTSPKLIKKQLWHCWHTVWSSFYEKGH